MNIARPLVLVVGRGPRGQAMAQAVKTLRGAQSVVTWSPAAGFGPPELVHNPMAELPALLAAVRPRWVSLCCPTDGCLALARAAWSASADVWAEAPLAPTAAAAQDFCVQAEGAGRRLWATHVSLYHPPVALLLAYAASHRLGAVQSVYSYAEGPLPPEAAGHRGRERLVRLLLPHVARAKHLAVLSEMNVQRLAWQTAADAEDLHVRIYYEDEILVSLRHRTRSGSDVSQGLMVTCQAGVLRWRCEAGGETLTCRQQAHERALPFRSVGAADLCLHALLRADESATPAPVAQREAIGVVSLLQRLLDG